MRLCAALLVVAGLVAGPARAEDKADEEKAPVKLTAAELADKINAALDAKIKARKAKPAPAADDAELVRRLHLDLSGRIPDLMTARDYIDSPEKDKREALIDKLLDDDRYAVHWANVWRGWLLHDTGDQQLIYLAPQFEVWLRGRLKANISYDSMVRSLVTSSNRGMYNGAGPSVFLQVNQFKAENVASAVARVFLGVKVECAQCHDHPFAKWKRKQFWETAAFFSDLPDPFNQVDAQGRPIVRQRKAGEIKIPGGDKVAKAKFLDGKEPKVTGNDYRGALVDWMVRKDNPYFARAAVNRVWEQLMGIGLVEPLDEESVENPPSHPGLLTLMAQQFAEHKYDLKYLIKAIVSSRAYQRTSKQTDATQADHRLFARMKVRGLSPEQMFDSLSIATGHKDDDAPYDPRFGLQVNFNSARSDFVRRFPAPDKRTEQHTSILQALYLMNGTIVADATSLEKNKNLAIIAEGKSVPTGRRVDQLFLITLNRKPTKAERERLVKYVDKGGPKKDPARALCDVFWALLNSSEFCVNH